MKISVQMSDERTYIVMYDISNSKRWRSVFKVMNGFGEWLQLSVFQCRLSKRRRAELETELCRVIEMGKDHVLIIDIGPANKSDVAVVSLGKTYSAIERQAIIV